MNIQFILRMKTGTHNKKIQMACPFLTQSLICYVKMITHFSVSKNTKKKKIKARQLLPIPSNCSLFLGRWLLVANFEKKSHNMTFRGIWLYFLSISCKNKEALLWETNVSENISSWYFWKWYSLLLESAQLCIGIECKIKC